MMGENLPQKLHELADELDEAFIVLKRQELQIQDIAANQADKYMQQIAELRSQIDAWRLFSQLRRDVDEITDLIEEAFENRDLNESAHELRAVQSKLRIIREREI